MRELDIDRIAQYIVDAIQTDISGRSGLGDEFDQIGKKTKREIVGSWKRIVRDILLKDTTTC